MPAVPPFSGLAGMGRHGTHARELHSSYLPQDSEPRATGLLSAWHEPGRDLGLKRLTPNFHSFPFPASARRISLAPEHMTATLRFCFKGMGPVLLQALLDRQLCAILTEHR